MPADVGLTTIYDNIGVILGIGAAIAGTVANFVKQHFNHGKNEERISKIAEYLNEAHSFTTNNHDKFVGLVQAATDLSPELKHSLEANGADINKVVADSEQGKAALKRILDELNTLTDLEPEKK